MNDSKVSFLPSSPTSPVGGPISSNPSPATSTAIPITTFASVTAQSISQGGGTSLNDRSAVEVPKTDQAWAAFIAKHDVNTILTTVGSPAAQKQSVSLPAGLGLYLQSADANDQKFQAIVKSWMTNQPLTDVFDRLAFVADRCGEKTAAITDSLKALRNDAPNKEVFDSTLRDSWMSPKIKSSVIPQRPSNSPLTPGQDAYSKAYAGNVAEVKDLLRSVNSNDLDAVRDITLGVLQGIRNNVIPKDNPSQPGDNKGSPDRAVIAAQGDLRAGKELLNILNKMGGEPTGLSPDARKAIMREAFAFLHDPEPDSFKRNIQQAFSLTEAAASEVVKSFGGAAEVQPAPGAKHPAADTPRRLGAPTGRPLVNQSLANDLGRRGGPVPSPRIPDNLGVAATASGQMASKPMKADSDLMKLVRTVTNPNDANVRELIQQQEELRDYSPRRLGSELGGASANKNVANSITLAILLVQQRNHIDDGWCVKFFSGFASGLHGRPQKLTHEVKAALEQTLKDRPAYWVAFHTALPSEPPKSTGFSFPNL